MGPTSWLTLSSRTRARRRNARRVLWEALECRVVPALSFQPLGLPLDETLTSLTQPVTQTLAPVLSPLVSTTEPLVESVPVVSNVTEPLTAITQPLSPILSPTQPLLSTPLLSNVTEPLTDAIAPHLLESSPAAPAPSPPILGGLLPSLFSPQPETPTILGFPSLPNGPQDGEGNDEDPALDGGETGVAGRTDENNRPGQITRGTPPGSTNDADAVLDDSTVAVAPLARAVSGTRPSRGPVAPEFDRGGMRQAELTPESDTREDASQPVPVEDPLEEVIYGKRNLLRKPVVKAPQPAGEAGQAAADVAPTDEEPGESAQQAGFVAADPLLLILAAGAAVAGTWSQTKRGQVLVANVRDAAFRSRRWLEQALWRA